MSNLALWEGLLMELDERGRALQWAKLSSHLGIEGNTQADFGGFSGLGAREEIHRGPWGTGESGHISGGVCQGADRA